MKLWQKATTPQKNRIARGLAAGDGAAHLEGTITGKLSRMGSWEAEL
jgi:hypothetical protein